MAGEVLVGNAPSVAARVRKEKEEDSPERQVAKTRIMTTVTSTTTRKKTKATRPRVTPTTKRKKVRRKKDLRMAKDWRRMK